VITQFRVLFHGHFIRDSSWIYLSKHRLSGGLIHGTHFLRIAHERSVGERSGRSADQMVKWGNRIGFGGWKWLKKTKVNSQP
jgi:hypothetical protein